MTPMTDSEMVILATLWIILITTTTILIITLRKR